VNDISRIAISTGGGDAPGLNAVIRSVTLAARNRGWQVVGIRDGFNGLMHPEEYRGGGLLELAVNDNDHGDNSGAWTVMVTPNP
jgi:6-phosphofructokinase 1